MRKLTLAGISHWASEPTGGILSEEVVEYEDCVRHNMNEIMRCALSIDNLMGDFISRYFSPSEMRRQSLFDNWIAHSSSLTFKSKADIVFASINDDPMLKDRFSVNAMRVDFQRIMKFRNAFAHGKLVGYEDDGEFVVHHFRGKPESDTLDLARFTKIGDSCDSLHRKMLELIHAITRTSSDRG